MSKHNRERRLLWKLRLSKHFTGRKLTPLEIIAAKAAIAEQARAGNWLPKPTR